MSVLRALMALLLAFLVALCSREAHADRPQDPRPTDHPRFLYPGLEGSLAAIAWKSLAHDLVALQPVLEQQAMALRDGTSAEPVPDAGPLRLAVRAHVDRMTTIRPFSGTGPHGVFTNPAILVNAIHFTLDEGHTPLTQEQADELYFLGGEFVAKERLRVQGAQSEPLALAGLLAEMRLRSELLDWARATLTPKQQLLLEPTSTRDLVGWSYFSGASVLSPHAQPVAYVERSGLVDVLVRWHIGRFGFGAGDLSALRAHLARFVERLPEEPDVQNRGVLSVSFAVKMAESTADLRRVLLAENSFSWAQHDRIRRERRFCVPVRIAAPLR